jgi:aspartate aminotransferase-like enzyme/GNAT superfamily N-acetyltransferase
MGKYTFKIASDPWEMEEIHRLNYRTFVEEIPQHERNEEHRLVDRFHNENTYLIALEDDALAGMMAVRSKRPFSLDEKLENLDSYIPPGRNLTEVRLLTIDPEHRNRKILLGLLKLLHDYCIDTGIDMAVISGTVRQKKLYARMGFTPFGPLVGKGTALYQPMYIAIETFDQYLPHAVGEKSSRELPEITNLLPGPVRLNETVLKTFGSEPVSHRSPQFLEAIANTREMLCGLTNAAHVEIMQGGGTLANDVVAWQLRALAGPGIVLVNGEFGARLADQARRAGLDFRALEREWGAPVTRADIEGLLDDMGGAAWLWSVNCESSTGVINDLAMLKALCGERGIKLCMDCTSTLGTMEVDLSGVWLASGSSGKGLVSLPGLGLVFASDGERPSLPNVPRCLDLGYYIAKGGMPFTLSSNLVLALQASLRSRSWKQRYQQIAHEMAELRRIAERHGLDLLTPVEHSSPAILTIIVPTQYNSVELAEKLARKGYLLSCHSDYLVKRNWIQICLMGDEVDADFEHLVQLIADPGKIEEQQS